MIKKILLLIVVISIATFSYFSSDIRQLVNLANGFAAKNICSGYYNSGYSLSEVQQQALIPIDPTFGYVSIEHDEQNKELIASMFGFLERKAVYREGLGCTLLGVEQQQLTSRVNSYQFKAKLRDDIEWPNGLAAVNSAIEVDAEALNSAIDRAFSEPNNKTKRQAKAVAIVHKGQLIAERYAAPISKHTPLLSWSMAKSVTNLLIGTLVYKNKLDIYQPTPVALWQQGNDPRSKITIDHMLRMSSGLEFNETYGLISDVSIMLSSTVSNADYAKQKPLIYEPDTHWAYASGTSNILAQIVFNTIGGNLQNQYEYAQRELFEPLNIHTAITEMDGSDTFVGSSYFYASARDWAKLGQLMLQDGVWNGQRLLPEGWVKYSSTATATAPKSQYGAHFWLNAQPSDSAKESRWPSAPNDIYYMGGYQGQFVIIVPSHDLVIVRLGFTYPKSDAGMEDLIVSVIEALSKK